MRATILRLIPPTAVGAMLLVQTARGSEPFNRWRSQIDMGGAIPQDATLTRFGGPVSRGEMKLNAGFQFDMAAGYRLTPWLDIGPELGFTYNIVDSIGGWSYHDTGLGQILMIANVRIEYPPQARLAPFVGAGIGGDATFLTFGGHYDYYYDYNEPDGTGADISLAYQAFAGLRYRVSDQVALGVTYRYLATKSQCWDVDWWTGNDFDVAVDSIRMHSVCLVFSAGF